MFPPRKTIGCLAASQSGRQQHDQQSPVGIESHRFPTFGHVATMAEEQGGCH
jgi:hypothetical protein